MKKFLWLSVVVVLVLVGGKLTGFFSSSKEPVVPFRTVEVTRGDLLLTVSATGTVEPEEVVDIGAQVVGRINELGKDPRGRTDKKFAGKHVDYGSPVEEGMTLAQIDPSVYDANFKQADAAVLQAKAQVLQAEAKLSQSEAEWKRAGRLRDMSLEKVSPTGSKMGRSIPVQGITDADYVLAKANYESAQADLAAAKATVNQQEASLLLAKTNLSYTLIKSPVSGTIIDRRVNIGQTVVSSLSAPSLFLIARDLRRMQVWASVNEADIGRLKIGMPVNFSVDAFPDDLFRGEVFQIRLNAAMTSNVVVYTVVITVDNSDLKLLPYLTANVKFEIDRRDDVLLVPNAALRYQPRADLIEPGADAANDASNQPDSPESAGKKKTFGNLWLLRAGTALLYSTKVEIGSSDGTNTEVISDSFKQGDQVVTGEAPKEAAGGEVNNPFAPPKFRGNKKSPASK